jgi:arabinose-5-phosphate isomerase
MIVKDVMLPIERFPVVKEKTILKEALTQMGKSNLGLVCIVDNENKLLGLITDGDLRRMILRVQKPFSAFFVDDAISHSNKNPLTCSKSDELKSIVNIMGTKEIWDIPVIDENDVLIGLVHLHSAIKKILL